jgi:hypothetical protein
MNTEKTKAELSAELTNLRAEIDAKKAERKSLAEKEKAILSAAKEKGISLSVDSYSRGDSVADAILSLSNGESFTVSGIAAKANRIGIENGKKDNSKESETVFRNISAFAVRFGIIEKTGKDSFRFVSTVTGKKVSNG